MTIIDLDAARATRASELQAAREATDTVVTAVTKMAESYAEMAFSLSGTIRLQNEQFAVDVNRSQWRRALTTVKNATRKAQPSVRQQLRDFASHAFAERLHRLIREQDRQLGLPLADEVVGAMWVRSGLTPWKPKPWPCILTLGRLDALAWMSHIERTPYAMKPATRQRFDEARKALENPEKWPGSEAEANRRSHYPDLLGTWLAPRGEGGMRSFGTNTRARVRAGR